MLRFGFDSISYDPIDPAMFAFTPPEGATVTTKTVDGDAMRAKADEMQQAKSAKAEPTKAQKEAAQQAVQGALLTREQVAKLVPFELAWARDYAARPLQWGYVLSPAGPLTESGAPLMQTLGAVTGMDLTAVTNGSHAPRSGAATDDPSSVLLYGQGFGTIVLAQTTTTPDLEKQLEQLQQTSQILGTATVDGATALKIGTPLGGVIVWQKGGTTLVAGGMVPMSDLETFASSVR